MTKRALPMDLPSVGISYAFDENAISNLSRYASRHNILRARTVPNRKISQTLARVAAQLFPEQATTSDFLASTARKRASEALDCDREGSLFSEIIRIGGARFTSPFSAYFGLYAWKVLFDRSVAHQAFNTDVLFGMPGSCLQTFKANPDAFRVFHALDAHPRERNSMLLAAYPRQMVRQELAPESLIARIDAELALADLVLTPSELVRQQMIRQHVDPKKVIVEPYGVDISSFRVLDTTTDMAERPTVVFVGQVCARKGIPYLISAVAGLDLDLVVVGNVFDRDLVAALPPNVRLVGKLGVSELVAELNHASAFVLPTVEDACALVVAEAAATGLPVITTTANGSADLLRGDAHQIIQPGSVTALRAALTGVKPLTLARRQEIAAQAREPGTRIRSWDDYSRSVYQRLSTLV